MKTFCALGAYGMAAITALTVQNSLGVKCVNPVDPEVLYEQIDAVLQDDDCDAIKIGMLATWENVRAVARALQKHSGIPVVLDPVLVSTSGTYLLEETGWPTLIEALLPLAIVFTPNRTEAAALLHRELKNENDLIHAAKELREAGALNVLITGGDHSDGGTVSDVWCDNNGVQILTHPAVQTIHTRGTGCALAAAISVGLARSMPPYAAVTEAREFVRNRLAAATQVGKGRGPVNHLLLK